MVVAPGDLARSSRAVASAVSDRRKLVGGRLHCCYSGARSESCRCSICERSESARLCRPGAVCHAAPGRIRVFALPRAATGLGSHGEGGRSPGAGGPCSRSSPTPRARTGRGGCGSWSLAVQRDAGVGLSQRGTVLSTTSWHLVVRTSSPRLFAYRRGRRRILLLVIVGKPSTPTPQGQFFVEESVLMPSDSAASAVRPCLERPLQRAPGVRRRPGTDRDPRHRSAARWGPPSRTDAYGSTPAITWLANRITWKLPTITQPDVGPGRPAGRADARRRWRPERSRPLPAISPWSRSPTTNTTTKRRRSQRDRPGSDPGERVPVDAVAPVLVEQIGDDEGAQHRDRQQRGRALHAGLSSTDAGSERPASFSG